jgi:hypothetical protein
MAFYGLHRQSTMPQKPIPETRSGEEASVVQFESAAMAPCCRK